MKALILYDLQRSAGLLAITWLLTVGYLIFAPAALNGQPGSLSTWGGLLLGIALPIRLMFDTGSTQAYICSRGLSRRQIMIGRCGLILSVLAGLAASVWLLLAVGVRGRLHQLWNYADRVYFPAIDLHEMTVLRPFLWAACFSCGVTLMYLMWRGVNRPSSNASTGGMLRLVLMELPVGAVTLFVALSTVAVLAFEESRFSGLLNPGLFWGPPVLLMVGMATAIGTSRYLEVNS